MGLPAQWLKNLFSRLFNQRESPPTLTEALKKIKPKRRHIDLEPYLQKFTKKEWQDKKINPKRFSLVCKYVNIKSWGCKPFDRIYYDAPYQFILMTTNFLRRMPIANIGFNVDTQTTTIIVEQIQGVRGAKTALAPLRWEKMLVYILIDWAKKNGAKRVEIIKAENNYWYVNPHNKSALFLKYDITARRCGFRLDPESDRYVYKIGM